MTTCPTKDYYVYLHTRKDGVIFYVGKGRGKRAKSTANRNPHWKSVVAKHDGFNIVMVSNGLTEEQAIELEAELIANYKKFGCLTNILDRGDIAPSSNPLVAKKISNSLKGIKRSDETKAKLKAVVRTAEWGKKISEAAKGRIMSAQTRAKLAAASAGRTHSDRTKEIMRQKAKCRSMDHLQTPEVKKLASERNAFRGKKRPEVSELLKSRGIFVGEKNPMYGKGYLQEGAKNHMAKPVNGIHIYYGVAQWETLSSAAKSLGVTIQAVSQSIRNGGRSKGWRMEMAS
jgi:hypothetical protein